MTKLELLELVVGRARTNGFAFRRWYTTHLGRTWDTAAEAIHALGDERRYYALLFSHEFARGFWKSGTEMTFQVATQQFPRRAADGTIKTVVRKGYTRRLTREDAWRYHLREMALAEEPLRYIRRFLPIAEELEPELQPPPETPIDDPRFIIDEEDLLEDENEDEA